jgi:hypothetical protein
MRLTKEQQLILRAVVDRLIPPDDFPGAWQAGVGDYLANQFGSDLVPLLDDYGAGLTALEAEARARFQSRFPLLTLEQQDAILKHIEAGEILTSWDIDPSRFFNFLVNTTAEGFYSDPEQGGNRERISWSMTGFEEHEQS